MKPFVIVATLRTPVALSRPLHLDGLLLAAAFRLDASKPASLDGLIATENGVYKASAGVLIYDGLTAPIQPVTRIRGIRNAQLIDKVHAEPSMGAASTQIDAMSPYRNKLTPHRPIAGASEIAWQALGDPERTLALASSIDNVGTMHSQGFGEVVSWRIEDCAASECDAGWRADARLLRRLPLAQANSMFDAPPAGALEDVAPVAPPYWAIDDMVPVLEPTLASLIMREELARSTLAF